MRYCISLVLFCFFCTVFVNNSFSQEQLGLRLENYSGVNALSLNPAYGNSSAFSWDLNLISAGVFLETNYGYIKNANVFDVIQPDQSFDVATNYSSENQYPPNTLIADYYDNNKRKFFNASTIVHGPSLQLNLESGHSFGVFTNFRTAVSAQRIPSNLNFYFFDRTPLGQEFEIEPFNMAAMSWSEIGLNYSYRIFLSNANIDIGGSVKFLNGYEGAFFTSEKEFGLTQFPGDSLGFNAPIFEFGLTTGNADGENIGLSRNGGGVGFDLGAVYTLDGYEDYVFKIGVALLDIGKINFTRNAESHLIDTDTPYDIPTGDYDQVNDYEELIDMLSEQSLGMQNASFRDTKFGIWLPGAFSVQADYRITPMVYANATWIQRLPYQENAVKRGNLLAVVPRFEHRWFSAMLPVSLYNYSEFRLGASIRLGFLTVGTDNLGSFTSRSDFTGSDIYFAIKVNPFNLGFDFGGIGNKRKGGKGVKCYEF